METDATITNFINEGSASVPGWFHNRDMALFFYLTKLQGKVAKVEGDICEVGVYAGKSLILLGMMSNPKEKLVAMDLFLEDFLEQTQANMKQFCPSVENVEYVKCETSELSVDGVQKHFPRPLRFLHIDAGHEYHEVLHSLVVLAPYVANGGIIVMDDYHDREFPGIEAATLDFCAITSPRQFVPFVVGHNKIYLTTPRHAHLYMKALLKQPRFADKCRPSRIRDHQLLVPYSKRPLPNEQILKLLSADEVPYRYDIDEQTLAEKAINYAQFRAAGKI